MSSLTASYHQNESHLRNVLTCFHDVCYVSHVRSLLLIGTFTSISSCEKPRWKDGGPSLPKHAASSRQEAWQLEWASSHLFRTPVSVLHYLSTIHTHNTTSSHSSSSPTSISSCALPIAFALTTSLGVACMSGDLFILCRRRVKWCSTESEAERLSEQRKLITNFTILYNLWLGLYSANTFLSFWVPIYTAHLPFSRLQKGIFDLNYNVTCMLVICLKSV